MTNSRPQVAPLVVVTAGIIFQNEKILITKRKIDAHQGGLWEFPGGKQELGETLEDCLRRELKEEVDIEVINVKAVSTFRYRYPDKEVELHFFTCTMDEGEPKALECSEWAWVPRRELLAYDFPAADQPILRQLLEEKI